MRRPTAYEIYLSRMRDYYKIKNHEQPDWIEQASIHYYRLYNAKQDLDKMCSNSGISKSTMEWLASIKDNSYQQRADLPEEIKIRAADIFRCLSDLYDELIEGKNEYFIHEWTLTKTGRRKMRDYINKMPSLGEVTPPQTDFTNVPDTISYVNRMHRLDAEYELTVTFNGSRICVRNGDKDYRDTEYFSFTERFLDSVIPIVQRERLSVYLKEKDRSENRDDSIYQGFKTVLVDLDRDDCDLNLLTESDSNPFIELLHLIWEEYADTLKEKDLVLPWFKVLGWA